MALRAVNRKWWGRAAISCLLVALTLYLLLKY
jgi:hypothetical protein